MKFHRILKALPARRGLINQYYWTFYDNTEKLNIIKRFGVISVTPIFLCLGLVLILRHTSSDF